MNNRLGIDFVVHKMKSILFASKRKTKKATSVRKICKSNNIQR